MMMTTEHATSVRLNANDLGKLDRVVDLLATSEAARLAGGRGGRSAVLRLAIDHGRDSLLAAARKGGPTASPLLPANAPDDDYLYACRLGASEGGPKR